MLKLKRGQVREDGLVFFGYNRQCKNGQRWITKELFEKSLERDRLKKRELRKNAGQKINEQRRLRYLENREKILSRNAEWFKKNKDKVRKSYSERQLKLRGTEEFKKRNRLRRRKYLSKDPMNRAIANARSRIYCFAKSTGMKKSSGTLKMLGCDKSYLKDWISSKFKEGMSWQNYGLWHIDHIVPISYAKSINELERLCHYTNLQPLWASENCSKNNKLTIEARAKLRQDSVEVITSPVQVVHNEVKNAE